MIPLGGASCHLEFWASESCGCCHEMKTRKYLLYFCSAACLLRYVDESREVLVRNVERFRTNPSFPCKLVQDGDAMRCVSDEEGGDCCR
jgi:hypothetical protein